MFSEKKLLQKNPINEGKELVSKKAFETEDERQRVAEKFVASLSKKPKLWKLSGSSARGDFKPNSDVDIVALYEKEQDIPYDEIFARQDQDNDLIDGFIDFHYFSEDWTVYQQNPTLLEELKKSLV